MDRKILHDVFMAVFGNFSMDTNDVAKHFFKGDGNAAYAALSKLRKDGLLTGEMVNGRGGLQRGRNIGILGEQGAQNITWQCWETYDNIDEQQAEANFNKQYPESKTMTTKAQSRSSKQSNTKVEKSGMTTKSSETPKRSKKSSKAVAPRAAKKGATRERIAGEAKIKVMVKENPRRGKLSERTFKLYKTGMTVAQFREECRKHKADPGYLLADIRKGYITVH